VLWDLPAGIASAGEVHRLAAKYGLRPGSINPNLFEDQIYKFGSLGNPDAVVRQQALNHIFESIEIMNVLGSRDLSLWLADGSNYPGTQNIRHRKKWIEEQLATAHAALGGGPANACGIQTV